MKRDLIAVYRKSSPRTGRDYDVKMIEKRQLAAYLKRGYLADKPKKKPKPDKEPESERPKIRGVEKKLFDDLTDDEKGKIARSKLSVAKLVKKYGTTSFTVRKIKRLKDELDKKTTGQPGL